MIKLNNTFPESESKIKSITDQKRQRVPNKHHCVSASEIEEQEQNVGIKSKIFKPNEKKRSESPNLLKNKLAVVKNKYSSQSKVKRFYIFIFKD